MCPSCTPSCLRSLVHTLSFTLTRSLVEAAHHPWALMTWQVEEMPLWYHGVLRLLGLDGERGKDVCTRWEPLYGRPCFYAPPSTPCPCTCACVERASDDTSALCDGASPGAATSTANTSVFASTAASHPGGAVVTGVASRAGNKSSQASPVGKSTRPKIRPKRVRPGRLEAHSKGTGRRLLDFYTTRELAHASHSAPPRTPSSAQCPTDRVAMRAPNRGAHRDCEQVGAPRPAPLRLPRVGPCEWGVGPRLAVARPLLAARFYSRGARVDNRSSVAWSVAYDAGRYESRASSKVARAQLQLRVGTPTAEVR
jgi:hypothetical protein